MASAITRQAATEMLMHLLEHGGTIPPVFKYTFGRAAVGSAVRILKERGFIKDDEHSARYVLGDKSAHDCIHFIAKMNGERTEYDREAMAFLRGC